MKLILQHVCRLGTSISTLGGALMFVSFLFPFIVTKSGASSPVASAANWARTTCLPEFFFALAIISTSAPAMFHTVSRLVVWIRALAILLNIPLILFLSFIVAFAMSGGSPDGGVAIEQLGGEMPGPGLLLLWFGILFSVIGCIISFIIWLFGMIIKKIRQPGSASS